MIVLLAPKGYRYDAEGIGNLIIANVQIYFCLQQFFHKTIEIQINLYNPIKSRIFACNIV